MTDPATIAVITSVASLLGQPLYDALKILADKGVGEPITQPMRDWLRRGYDKKKDDETLRQVLHKTLAKIEPASDQWENTLAAIKLTGLSASQAKLITAAAIEMRVYNPEVLPEDLFVALNIDPSRRVLLARFLFELREELAHAQLPEYRDAIAFADRLDERDLLRGLTQTTGRLVALSERRLSIEEAMRIERLLETDDAVALSAYLAETRENWGILPLPLIRKRNVEITQAGLKKIYVPLQLRDRQLEKQPDGRAPKASRKTEFDTTAELEFDRQVEVLDLGDLLSRYERFILLGPPGCGKSTLLHRAALAFSEGRAAVDLGWQGAPLLPIFIRLRNYASYLEKNLASLEPSHGSFVAYLNQLYRDGQRISLTPNFFDRRLEEGGCLVLMDGLDEVSGMRSQLAQQVNAFIQHYAPKGNRIGLASRPKGYLAVELQLARAGLAVIDVNPLDPNGIRSLITNLFTEIEVNSTVRRKDIEELYRAILSKTELVEIAGIPLFCSALVQVSKYSQARLPERRVDVLEQIIDLLLGFWKAQDDALVAAEELAKEDGTEKVHRGIQDAVDLKRRRLAFLADWMQQVSHSVEVEADQAIDLFAAYFLENERLKDEEKAREWARGFLENSHERSGMLVESETGKYAFFHKAFMEYLAAWYLVNQIEKPVETMLEHAGEDWWEQVILLAGAREGTPDTLRKKLVNVLLDRSQEQGIQRSGGFNPLLLAGRLARDMAGRLPGLELERTENALLNAALKQDCGSRARAAAADVLDELGWLPEGLYQYIQVPAHPQLKPPLTEFWIARYPTTNLQYERFLTKENFENTELWTGFPKYGENSRLMENQDWGDAPWKWLQSALKDRDRSPDGEIVYPRYWFDSRFGIARKTIPVVGVTWYEAMAYCRWLERNWPQGEQQANPGLSPREVRLPTDVEWETAAGRQEWIKAGKKDEWEKCYPWDQPGQPTTELDEIPRRANVDESQIGRTTPVGMYPMGASYPYGLWDLAGNAWEWQVNYRDQKGGWLGLRGGAWGYSQDLARPSVRDFDLPDLGWYYYGFRVVVRPG